MANWINYPTTLIGQTVDLVSLNDNHLTELKVVAKDKRIWEHYAQDLTNSEVFDKAYQSAIIYRERGLQFPFVIYHKADNKIIGSTRLKDIEEHNKRLEIGFTWLNPAYWGTEINLECKLLLLTYCFETLGTVRVQLRTDVKNIRSRKAIEKIGAKCEGIFRNDMLRADNTRRDSVYFSIIEQEWPETKLKLEELYRNKLNEIR